MHPSVVIKKNHVLVTFYVKPNSRKNKIEINPSDIILKINAPPRRGKANKAILKFLSKKFDLQNNYIEFVAGLKSQDKIIKLYYDDDEQLKRILDILGKD